LKQPTSQRVNIALVTSAMDSNEPLSCGDEHKIEKSDNVMQVEHVHIQRNET
jgi:hypothetical protein